MEQEENNSFGPCFVQEIFKGNKLLTFVLYSTVLSLTFISRDLCHEVQNA